MSKTGPQKYPGASQAYRYQNQFGGDSMESNVIVWHTTEGTSLSSYSGGSEAPNFTAVPDFAAKRLRWYQHFDFDTSSRALVNKAGGVETNTLNVCQIELVGTCDPTTHNRWTGQHLYTPSLPDWVIRDLAAFAKWAHDEHGVPLTSGVTFKAYPSSYGNSSVRMSGSKWESFRGHCGHQHVPENDHGDPGAFPMAAILAAAAGGSPITPPEDDMPISIDDVKKFFSTDGAVPAARPPVANSDYPANDRWTAGYAIQTAVEDIRKTRQAVEGLAAPELTDAQVATIAAAVAEAPGLADAIASKVADLLAARLAD